MLTITSDVFVVRRCVKQLIKKITTDVFCESIGSGEHEKLSVFSA